MTPYCFRDLGEVVYVITSMVIHGVIYRFITNVSEARLASGGSRFAEIRQHWVNELESLINLLSDLCTGQDNLARDENEQNDFWFHL